MKTILLIEDNETIKMGLDYLFLQNDFLLLWAPNLKKAEEYLKTKSYDLILLDVTLPDGSGFDFFRKNKEIISVPVLFLTAKDLEDDIVMGLELGATDYIVKPFRNRELILRINNALKFANQKKCQLVVQNIVVDLESMKVFCEGKEILFTALEYKLFLFLVENANRVVSREAIFDSIWDESGNYVNDNTLTVYIKRIRKKLGKEDFIKTIKGIGYRVDSE